MHLPRAPIVEAVIDVRGTLGAQLDESAIRAFAEQRLAGYDFLDSQREFVSEFKVSPGMPPFPELRDAGWKGVRFRSKDAKHIVQFNRNGFVFSRLEPYVDWQQLSGEAGSLRHMYGELAPFSGIDRIGLRYINRIPMPLGETRYEDYFDPAPEAPHGFTVPMGQFMHHDLLTIPGHPYAANVIRTVVMNEQKIYQLILDIDVFAAFPVVPASPLTVEEHLQRMRWVKNKIFFGSLTKHALEAFQ